MSEPGNAAWCNIIEKDSPNDVEGWYSPKMPRGSLCRNGVSITSITPSPAGNEGTRGLSPMSPHFLYPVCFRKTAPSGGTVKFSEWLRPCIGMD
jgi:hypothetical protein